jgi:hypothetical protein
VLSASKQAKAPFVLSSSKHERRALRLCRIATLRANGKSIREARYRGRRVIPAKAGIQHLACRYIVVTLCALLCTPSFAQSQCKVLDPELQSSYSGGCKDGLADGYGEAVGLALYKGEFKAGRKHGKGIKTWPSGDRYDGEFVEDRKEGQGVYSWGPRTAWAGEKYTGHFVDDRRDGEGVYEWPNGDRYSGPWKNDVMIGKATPRMLERARAYIEHVVAVGRVGAKVCREMTVGIAKNDTIQGIVTEATNSSIAVRIENAGKFDHTLNGVEVVRGSVLWDTPTAWAPCS